MSKKITSMRLLLLSFFFLFSVTACQHQSVLESSVKPIEHIILVWLKEGTTQAEIDTIIAETKKLKQIPTVIALSVGSAIQSDRKIVDDSFDLGIRVAFANQKDMDIYLKHPQHVAFVKAYVKPSLDRLLVYDF